MSSQEIVELSLSFSFECAHFMPNFPEGHPNRKIHGHSYEATVTLRGPINPQTGVLIDLDDFYSLGKKIVKPLDHAMLNDFPMLELPTSENICRYLWSQFSKETSHLHCISISRPTLGLRVNYYGPQ